MFLSQAMRAPVEPINLLRKKDMGDGIISVAAVQI